ncbi:class A beta-lactamase [Curtobacterium poinsettiae]|uniref:Beta-lactamase n=1 Tax=Curtobacterium poinsettiae TaxID=159612 RepID=A0ABT3S5H5_9MICO|nr:class A beta-lactamase [Curtobacterium flaccumfaciens]MBT1610849.1 class A beta-lactamase [Curtobacterium flaccumfaciens pv. poinsettiae]MCX2850075.1 class A beta-lactamase [Curtobacterium flaccumfaciens pv. poinsettiae]UXN18269.1 class A beta-lactamase [Curtobacterium flaccumfaciens pv. poinsettiae]
MRGGTKTTTTALTALVLVGLVGCSGEPGGASAPASAAASAPGAAAPATDPATDPATARAFASLERRYDARLGITAVDTGSGRTLVHRAGERFAFASTVKVFIAAAVLDASSDADLATVVHYDRGDLLEYAPVTSEHVDTGMTVRELIDAALRSSDNTAANLLVERLGGPDAVERWLRGIGDRTTRVDRVEPDLNQATPGDRRDTTTPERFAADLRAVLLGDVLDAADRRVLSDAMLGNTTGDATIRAGVDPSWRVADKTGTASYGVRNDIAVVTPPGRAPIVLVVMTSRADAAAEPSDALVAAATRAAVAGLTG